MDMGSEIFIFNNPCINIFKTLKQGKLCYDKSLIYATGLTNH